MVVHRYLHESVQVLRKSERVGEGLLGKRFRGKERVAKLVFSKSYILPLHAYPVTLDGSYVGGSKAKSFSGERRAAYHGTGVLGVSGVCDTEFDWISSFWALPS